MKKDIPNRFLLKTVKLAAVCLLFAAAVFARQYEGKPVTKERLVTALKTKALQTRQIVDTINNNGVDFQITPNVEAELVAAGARPEVLTAARSNYRAPAGRPVNTGNNGNNGNNGKPFSKNELLKIVRAKASSNGVILDLIETRGVEFETNASVEREFITAGASPAIITAMKSAYRGSGSNYNENTTTYGDYKPGGGRTKPGAVNYDDLIGQAIEVYNRDVSSNMPVNSAGRLSAIQILNQAVTLKPNNPIGYQQLGFMTLYGTSNGFSAAENNFKKAIELGGSAVFRVYHDHNGVFTETCNGSLYVSKDKVRFESDDNKHTFDVSDDDIKNIKTNSSFIKMFQNKPGSFKIVLKSGDNKNFNFAPLTENNEESKMVIRLIGK